MDHVIYRDYIVNRRFFLFTVVWPVIVSSHSKNGGNCMPGGPTALGCQTGATRRHGVELAVSQVHFVLVARDCSVFPRFSARSVADTSTYRHVN